MSEIKEIQVGEHVFKTPPIPDKKDILFSDKKKEHQYWKRLTDLPDFFFEWDENVEVDAERTIHDTNGTLTSLSKKDTDTLYYFQKREIDRRRHGIWFMNDGEPTYLTGNHYFNLQWGAMRGCTNYVEPGSNYGQYYQFQRDVAYFMEISRTTTEGDGGILVKSKKTGITQFVANACLNESMLISQKVIRIMSITEDEAKENNFNMIYFAIQKLPKILRPSFTKINEGEVFWGAPYGDIKKKQVKLDIEYLNTRLKTVATKRAAFDGMTNHIAWIDEFPKIKTSTYPGELFTTTLPTVLDSKTKVGFIFATSYVPETNDRSFREAKLWYYNSKRKTIDAKTGRTASKLICHIITAQEGLRDGCDKYGKPVIDKIMKSINEDMMKEKNNPLAMQAVKRQFPTCDNDAWMEGIGGSVFDNLRLDTKLQELEMEMAMGAPAYDDFNLEFTVNPIIDDLKGKFDFSGKIVAKFRTDADKVKGVPEYKFKWYRREWTPDGFLNQHLNNLDIDKRTGRLKPRYNCPFYASLDPTNFSLAKNIMVGSKNALDVFLLPNAELDGMIGQKVSNKRLMVEYFYRENNPTDTLFDVIKCILYFGCYILIENNMPTITTKLVNWGLGNFLIVVNKEGILEPYNYGSTEQKFLSTQKGDVKYYVAAGYEHNLGAEFVPEFDIDNVKFLDSRDTIKQLMIFDSEDTKEYDAAMAYLIGLYGIDSLLGWRKKENDRLSRKTDGTYRAAAHFMK